MHFAAQGLGDAARRGVHQPQPLAFAALAFRHGEGEFERDRPDPTRSTGLPPPAQADAGTLDILSLPPELGELIGLLGRWSEAPGDEATADHRLSEAVLGGRFAHAAYRLQLMPLLGDAQAQALKSPTGELARMPWQVALTPTLLKTADPEVALISEGHLQRSGRALPAEPTPSDSIRIPE
jgi:hypothetical protein